MVYNYKQEKGVTVKKIFMKALFHQVIKLENVKNQNIQQQHVESSNPLINSYNTQVIVRSPSYIWGNWGTKRVNNLTKIMQ